ncbi:putative extracellular protein [Streptococcus gallolyticus subsp. gallolyticus ATCC 43143]|nr:hypothetical protein HMPREF9352_0787 [Streptococcus gallolyticus subsp. gallolyticus TX20005]BAK27650.1 putative extracellular protein [Streptococcus gallolyticus subsp. gallolyticus ATCC 43143]
MKSRFLETFFYFILNLCLVFSNKNKETTKIASLLGFSSYYK